MRRTMESTHKKIKESIEKIKKKREARKTLETFVMTEPSLKQKKVFTWWREGSPVKDLDGIICDGSIRSGKTMSVSFSFLEWSMSTFHNQNFGLCGKTIGTFRRNIIKDLKSIAKKRGYKIKDKRSENCLVVTKKQVTNYYYIFGGKDESSQDLIQGITLAGAYLDEVVLMPKSFVDQCLARCSVEGSKYWFTCNPGNPHHYFKLDFIDKADEKNFLYLKFDMDDNPTLSEKKKEQYRRLYTGTFYQRYIEGLWVAAEGLIYQVSEKNFINKEKIPVCDEYYIAGDYGIYNPMAWGYYGVKVIRGKEYIYKIAEYHHSGRETQRPKSDEEYADDFIKWKEQLESEYGKVKNITFDPSAASFIIALKSKGIYVKRARNAVKGEKDDIAGIPLVQSYISSERYLICNQCIYTKKEIYSYIWDEKKAERGEEEPVKENDHHMDADRYMFNTFIGYRKIGLENYRYIGGS